jgi:hypothetical protein
MFARILLIFSVANVALAAPAAVPPVRQRHLDVAKAASEKRAPGSGNGATGGDLPPESSSAAANHITTQALGASGSGNGAMDDLPPESSSSAANHITTLGASGSGNGATDDLPPEPPSAAANRVTTTQALGASGDLPPPHQGSPESLVASDFSGPVPIKDPHASARRILGYLAVVSVLGGLVGFGYHELSAQPVRFSSLSSLSCGHLTESQTF